MKYLQKDWYDQPCPNVGFEITTSTQQWVFRVDITVSAKQPLLAEPQAYKEGLWKQDVAEWFIANPVTGRYVECNLAANGAWWLMAFSKPRLRINKELLPDLKGVVTNHEQHEIMSWQAELSIPKKLLFELLGQGEWTYNVCFVLGKEADGDKQYISLNPLTSSEPDFHRPNEFMTLLNED